MHSRWWSKLGIAKMAKPCAILSLTVFYIILYISFKQEQMNTWWYDSWCFYFIFIIVNRLHNKALFCNGHQAYSFLRKVFIFLSSLDQLVDWASRVQRLCPHCRGPGFKSLPWALCCVSPPLSLTDSCHLKLSYQSSHKKAKTNILKKGRFTFLTTDPKHIVFVCTSVKCAFVCDETYLNDSIASRAKLTLHTQSNECNVMYVTYVYKTPCWLLVSRWTQTSAVYELCLHSYTSSPDYLLCCHLNGQGHKGLLPDSK